MSRWLLALVVAASASLLHTSSASAAVPGGFDSWAELFAMQRRLNAVAERILATGHDGHGGIVAAPADRALTVYWKGTIPARVRAVAAAADVPVLFRPARFTHSELVAEAQRLAADPTVVVIGPAPDGSGLTATTTGPLVTSTMPVTLSREPAPQPLALNRVNDGTPYFGGGATWNPIPGSTCSTGFAVLQASVPRMLTSAHCGANGQLVSDGGLVPGVDDIGIIGADVDARDTQWITAVPGKTFVGRVFTGPWSSGTSRGVGGAAIDFVGNFVCTGGARSGEHCVTLPDTPPSQVTAVDQIVAGVQPLTRAQSVVAGGCVGVPGDSGGPVYSLRADCRVDVRGTLTTGILGPMCPNVFPGGPAVGAGTIWYAPALRPPGPTIGSLTFYGATPILG